MASKSPVKLEDDWRVESDLRTLMEAEAIKADSKRYEKAKELAKKNLMKMASVAGDSK